MTITDLTALLPDNEDRWKIEVWFSQVAVAAVKAYRDERLVELDRRSAT